MSDESTYRKIREEVIEGFLKPDESTLRLTALSSITEYAPEAVVFTDGDCKPLAALLADRIKEGKPVKRIVIQGCSEHPFLRGWFKDNGYIIYGEKLWDENGFLCHTTAAVLEVYADDREKTLSDRAFAAEVHIYGTEELYNEIPLMLWIDNNESLPLLLYKKLTEAEKIINDISGMTSDESKLPEELKAKKHAALLKKQQLSVMVNNMYPID